MRLVVQRVTSASVEAEGEELGRIERGALVLVGIAAGDTGELAERMAVKLLGLRYFEDADGRTNLAIDDVDGAFLVVSQFTLLADLRRRHQEDLGPSFLLRICIFLLLLYFGGSPLPFFNLPNQQKDLHDDCD